MQMLNYRQHTRHGYERFVPAGRRYIAATKPHSVTSQQSCALAASVDNNDQPRAVQRPDQVADRPSLDLPFA